MGKFKVGDRVRHVRLGYEGRIKSVGAFNHYGVFWDDVKWSASDPASDLVAILPDASYIRATADGEVPGTYKAGDVGKIDGRDSDGYRVNFGTGTWVVGFGDVEAWAPKVGDRVRFVVNYGSAAARGKEAVVIQDTSTWGYQVEQVENASRSTESLRSLEPILPAAPAPLKLEAGKFYRTRDGRKVGPFKIDGGIAEARGTFGWVCVFADTLRANGPKCPNNKDDLVALWQDEAKVNTAATVDYQAEEYGTGVKAKAEPKFKVGDRVRCIDNRGAPRDFVVGKEYTVTAVEDGMLRVGGAGMFAYRFELVTTTPTSAIVALIENGQPKPASRPFVHATVASANTEAARLAGVHKGSKFGVYVLTGEPALVEKPKAKTELTVTLRLDASDFQAKLAELKRDIANMEVAAASLGKRAA